MSTSTMSSAAADDDTMEEDEEQHRKVARSGSIMSSAAADDDTMQEDEEQHRKVARSGDTTTAADAHAPKDAMTDVVAVDTRTHQPPPQQPMPQPRDERNADVATLNEKALLAALKSSAMFPKIMDEDWGHLTVAHSQRVSDELFFLKQLTTKEPKQSTLATDCGIVFYSLEKHPSPKLLQLEIRASKLFFERDFYGTLYEEMNKLWKDEDKSERRKIILFGNAGVGKSWFQIYVLRRLLTPPPDRLFRFVLRQVGGTYFLYDLMTCAAYSVNGYRDHVADAISAHGRILYLYEPAQMVEQPPLVVEAPSLSTLSPRKNRIHEYLKSRPHELYMPVWEFNELECIADEEKLDLDVLKKNYYVFGGIFRHALIRNEQEREDKTKIVDSRCNSVTAQVLRSIGADIDDDPNAREGNVSGYVLSYTNIPRAGQNPFTSPSLALTSSYVRERIAEKMSLKSYHEHLAMLASVLQNKHKDHSGMDLENSVVYMLSVGPMTVKWQYQAVRGEPDTSEHNLALTKREITREKNFNAALVNYPEDKSYPLGDCVCMIDGVCWTFQTTWQRNHAFKLGTLRLFRNKLGLSVIDSLNVVFVNPAYTQAYANRDRNNYLAKGENVRKAILGSKKEVLMSAQDVTKMWENTRIFVAAPKGGEWLAAISKALGVDKVLNND